MRVGIVGAGLQAKRRAPEVTKFDNAEIVSITANNPDHAIPLSKQFDCNVANNWKELLDENLDAIIICTPPDSHAEIGINAMKKGIHVLCEKPLAKTEEECHQMINASEENNVILKCGFNHRYHPAITTIKKWIDKDEIGTLNFIRAKYGICGRDGLETEWRSNTDIVAGGQLMEQGIHLIDLMRWIMGDQEEVTCSLATLHWKIQPLEDNAFVTFKTKKDQLTNIHSSLTQWKNVFSFEVYGSDGYVEVDGLGSGYGTETAILGKKDLNGPFEYKKIEFRRGDFSWYEEWQEFLNSINENKKPSGNGFDGLEAVRLVLAAYKSAREKRTIQL